MTPALRFCRTAQYAILPLLLCGTAPEDRLVVEVRITGALMRNESHRHVVDADHRCDALRYWLTPSQGGPMIHSPARWEIHFAPNHAPPLPSFQLSYAMDGPDAASLGRSAALRITASGRQWVGGVGMEGVSAEIRPDASHRSGRFVLRGLRATGGTERIDVTGSWRCPVER